MTTPRQARLSCSWFGDEQSPFYMSNNRKLAEHFVKLSMAPVEAAQLLLRLFYSGSGIAAGASMALNSSSGKTRSSSRHQLFQVCH